MKVGLYSITYLGCWYRGEPLTLPDLIRTAKQFGYDGCITGVDRIDGVVTGETNQYYRDFVRAMREIGYQGYISYELCHQLPMVNGETVDIEFAHKNARLAAEFMREIIRTEYAAPPARPAGKEPAVAAR